jgi:hypothetical protein
MDKRTIFIAVGLLAASTAVLAQAYRWVDDEGVVHYSDRPNPGSERVVLPKSNTTTVRRYDQSSTSTDTNSAEPPPAAFKYESLTVASPGAEETLWNIEGVLNVSLAVSPALQKGHQVRVYFDGNPQTVSGSSFQIEEVHRGVHNIQAEVLDETGKLMIRSQTNRFYVQQNTVGF